MSKQCLGEASHVQEGSMGIMSRMQASKQTDLALILALPVTGCVTQGKPPPLCTSVSLSVTWVQ